MLPDDQFGQGSLSATQKDGGREDGWVEGGGLMYLGCARKRWKSYQPVTAYSVPSSSTRVRAAAALHTTLCSAAEASSPSAKPAPTRHGQHSSST